MSKKKDRILMFDETGMLSQEVLLGYVHGELSPMVKNEVEAIIKENAVYEDIIEGLRLIPHKSKALGDIDDLNNRVAQRTGATSKRRTIYFGQYRRAAAIIVASLFAIGVIWIVANVSTSDDTSLIADRESTEELIAELKEESYEQDEASSTYNPSAVTPPEDENEIVSKEAEANNLTAGTSLSFGTSDLSGSDLPSVTANSSNINVPDPPTIAQNNITLDKKEKTSGLKIVSGEAEPVIAEDALAPEINQEKAVSTGSSGYSSWTNDTDGSTSVNDLSRKSKAKEESRVAANAEDDQGVFLIVEEMPIFPGDEKGLIAYLENNINYPKKARKNDIEGTVYVTFVITKNGQVTQVEIVRGVNDDMDKEAKRVVEKMPPWSPGKQRGEPVPVKYTLPVKFELND